MKREYLLKGLDCPNCSAKIENEVKMLEYVTAAAVDLMKQKLSVEFGDEMNEQIDKDVKEIVASHEPDVEVSYFHSNGSHQTLNEHTEHCCEHDHCACENDAESEDDSKKDLIKIIIGAALYSAALILNAAVSFPFPAYISMLVTAYLILGGEVILNAFKNLIKGHIFDENFLMTVSTLGAFAIKEYPYAVAVMLFYTIGEYLQGLAVRRSRRSIAKLMDIRPDKATVLRDGNQITVYPDDVKTGEEIIVRPGEKIPIDGTVIEGESTLDTKALTGESVPRDVRAGDEILSGCININGVLSIKTTKSCGESTASKSIELVENASSKKAPAESFITKFAKYYTPAVVIAASLLALIPPLFFNGQWSDWLYRGFSFLVISCPCALVISIPLAYCGGIGAASRHGILVKGGNCLEALNKIDTVIFDKTGTVTKGVFKVSRIIPDSGKSADELIKAAAHAECFSNHPIAKSIEDYYGKEIDTNSVTDYEEISGYGVRTKYNGIELVAGNDKLMDMTGIKFSQCNESGTKVYVSSDGVCCGCIVISDEIKPDSKSAVSELKKSGIKTVMLTGDSNDIAADICAKTDIEEYHASLLPGEKVSIIETLRNKDGRKVAFAGDGLNDAPSIALADIGIAMGGIGSDAAIEAADFVLMHDKLSGITDAMKISKSTKKVVVENIIFSIGIKAIFLILSALGIASMWQAVFADVGVAMIAILNSIRILRK